MRFTDLVTVAGTRRTADGYLIADARVARVGVQIYPGAEVRKPELQQARVYRPEAEVFHKDALASFAHRPMTVGHPKDAVTAATWKTVAVGQTDGDVVRDGQFVRVPMMVLDASAIASIEAGDRELSAGYICDLEWQSGTSPAGEDYDAIQRNIRVNHIAIVARGRAGSEVRIGDDAVEWGAAPISQPVTDEREAEMAENTLRTVVVDGLSVSTTDQGAQAIEKLTKDRDDARAALAAANAAHTTAIAAKDADLAKKDALIDAEKAKVLSDAEIDKRVRARADLVSAATKIVKDVKTDGVSDADLRKAVVTAKLGDAAVKDKAQAYIDARFEILAEETGKGTDTVRDVLLSRDSNTGDAAADAYAAMVKDMQSAHRPAKAA